MKRYRLRQGKLRPHDSGEWVSFEETERIEDDQQAANDCLDMVRTRIEHLGEPMDATPPYNYNDAIDALLFRRLKEAGAFPLLSNPSSYLPY